MLNIEEDEWANGGPWIFEKSGFFDATLKHIKGTEKLRPFVVYLDHDQYGHVYLSQTRFPHEVAHMIACRDRNLFNPTWDHDEFLVKKINEMFSKEAGEDEIEVLVLDQILRNHFFEGSLDPVQSAFDRIRNYISIPSFEILEIARFWNSNWTIELAWEELQRKYEIIRKRAK